MVWDHLNVDSAHIAYAVIGVFSAVFSLLSLFVKEKLYIGEATVAAIVGLIVGPYCLKWFTPTEWGNSDYITLELSRIVLCLQIFAVAVELPKKYMMRHWVSVFMLLVPVMTWGFLIVGLFTWILIPGLDFAQSLVISACITATDPVLAAAVVGKGKFAQRVPGHLRNLLSAESGCNDGMAFPFIYLGINLVVHRGHAGEIIKDWIAVSILYECLFGCLLGVIIGYCGRHSIKFAERKGLIDRESFLAFYIVLALMCAGFGSMLGVDDLLVSFAAGAAFSWDGWFARKTEETHVSTVIDLLLNLAYFVYFGAIVPWPQFNDSSIGTNVWRLILLALVVIVLRRLPAVVALKGLIPDIKTWREAIFCGHFGPIGVGAIFASILARGELEKESTTEPTPLKVLPPVGSENYQLIACIWPIVTFLVVASILVHGSSVAVITLGSKLQQMKVTMSFTRTNGNPTSTSWMSRLPNLSADVSLQRIDTNAPSVKNDAGALSQSATVETTGVPAKPAGGMERRKKKKDRKRRKNRLLGDEKAVFADSEKLQREKEAKAAAFALGDRPNINRQQIQEPENSYQGEEERFQPVGITPSNTFNNVIPIPEYKQHPARDEYDEGDSSSHDNARPQRATGQDYESNRRPTNIYKEGENIIVEDQHGEILEQASLVDAEKLRRETSISSSLSSTRSPIERVSSAGSDSGHNKYIAYKLNDQLIIENHEGEVLRRYRIKHHKQISEVNRPKSASVASGLGKALKAVGITNKLGEPEIKIEDKIDLSPVQTEKDNSADSSSASAAPTSPANHSIDIIPEDVIHNHSEEDDISEEEEEEEDYEETEFEKRRRLEALGQIRAHRNDDDEEEEVVPQTPVKTAFANSLGLGRK
ncbi:hypothetical protein WICMUC_003584 [Wickerhamomyces mucosus]|uniref:Na+/H+ antiporter n=1 Tax=Wickerhamomyces mucosus TaxID=1378264 RepID=A0A9P8PLH9_9ASCO|nr:hypothetical protein WICMUC_003584 [Wickerhamomyces mucosus]